MRRASSHIIKGFITLMTLRKKTRLWSGLAGAALMAGGLTACGDNSAETETAEVETARPVDETVTAPEAEASTPGSAAAPPASTVVGEGEGGEGEGEGGSGGEFGIDPDAARTDPVVFLTALDVMRAHYEAGLEILGEEGQRSHVADLFSHPMSEIYVDFEPVLTGAGGPDLYDPMNQTARMFFDDAAEAEIRASAEDLLAQMDEAESFAPDGADSAAVQAEVIADMIERAALQYQLAMNEGPQTGETAYLDGFGLYSVAAKRADEHMDMIREASPEAADAIQAALDALGKAYPGANYPDEAPVDAETVLAASDAATQAVSAM